MELRLSGCLYELIDNKFTKRVNILAGETVFIDCFGKADRSFINNMIILIKKEKLFVGFADVEYGDNRFRAHNLQACRHCLFASVTDKRFPYSRFPEQHNWIQCTACHQS